MNLISVASQSAVMNCIKPAGQHGKKLEAGTRFQNSKTVIDSSVHFASKFVQILILENQIFFLYMLFKA